MSARSDPAAEVAEATHDRVGDDGRFADVLAACLEHEAVYLENGRLTGASPAYRDPGAFCSWIRQTVLTGAGLERFERRAAFYDAASAERPASKLLPVLASQDHLEHGHRRAALIWAERALTLNQDDLHAQRLYRLARGQPEPDLRGRFCENPFDKLETHSRGEVYFCCPAWLPKPIGNLDTESAEQIWNSPAAQEIRRSILDGSYRYCSRMHCPKITGGTLAKREALTNREHRRFIADGTTRLRRGPKRLVLNHDRSCNLSCPSCRTRIILAKKDEQERMNAFADRVLMPLLENAKKVHITASGDPFGSAHFRYVLGRLGELRLPGLRLDLQTHGLLLKTSWPALGLDGLVDSLFISVDAARPETYAKVRRGGTFERLLENLEFVAELRRAGRVRHVRLDFVVQAMNFREMPEAADLVRRFDFDGLKLQMIRSWNTYSAEDFARHHIGSPHHALFDEFLEVLGDPRLKADFVEFWGFHSVDPATLPARSQASTAYRRSPRAV